MSSKRLSPQELFHKFKRKGELYAMGGLLGLLFGVVLSIVLWFTSGATFMEEVAATNRFGDATGFTEMAVSVAQIFKFLLLVGFGGATFGIFGSALLVVREKSAAIIEVLGRYHSTKEPGLRLRMPWPVGQIAGTMNLRMLELGDTIGVKSKDNAFLTVPVKVQYRIMNPQKAHYELEHPEDQIKSYVVNTVRSEANGMDMDEIFKSKDQFEKAVNSTLNTRFGQYGYEIVNVLVDDPQPSDTLKAEFDKVLASQRRKEAATNDAEATRIKLVGEANAHGESIKIRGEAFKAFRNSIAEGNSEAMKKFLEGNHNLTALDVMNFMAIIDRHEAIRDAAKEPGTLVVVPVSYDAGSMAPQIAAIVDKVKTNQNGHGTPTAVANGA